MSYDKRQAAAEFKKWSESYDRSILQTLLFGPSHRALVERLKRAFGERPFSLLDVGCGTGVFASVVRGALPSARVFGVDLCAQMLEKGRERWRRFEKDVHPLQGDSERLPFPSGSFDVLTCANSFHHYPHQARAIAEMRRVLKPGGRLLLIDGYRDAPWGYFIYEVCVATIEGEVHHATRREVKDWFGAAGFGTVDQRVHRGAAPFLLTEGIAAPTAIPTPHIRPAATPSTRVEA